MSSLSRRAKRLSYRFGSTCVAVALLVPLLSGAATAATAADRPAGGALRPPTSAPTRPSRAQADTLRRLPLTFIENRGQTVGGVAYYVRGAGSSLFFSNDGVTIAFKASGTSSGWAVKEAFLGARPVTPVGVERTNTSVNFFSGPQSAWLHDVAAYRSIVYRGLWNGIDLAYSGTATRVKYRFVVHPGSDPRRIALGYRGNSGLRVDGSGDLVVSTPAGAFVDRKPVSYQVRDGRTIPVASRYVVDPRTHRVSFGVGRYDPSLDLVIDPAILVYAGYIGGIGTDIAYRMTVDGEGNLYVTGSTNSTEASFPVKVGPYLTYGGGINDAFVAKVNPSGSDLVYLGYIGGAEQDAGLAIAVDSSGAAYVTGAVKSNESTFPVLGGPDLTYNGGSFDAFITKVSTDGTHLIYSGYIGGKKNDEGLRIGVDGSGAAYIGGFATSDETTFPVKVGPQLVYQGGSGPGGADDGFIAKVAPDGLSLEYCGYVAGYGQDLVRGLAVDPAGHAYVAGYTASDQSTFPVTVGPDLTYNGGTDDAFVGEVKLDGSGYDFLGYLGGSDFDAARGLAVDTSGNVFIAGDTKSSDFPVLVGPGLTYKGGYDVFVAKLNATGTAYAYSGLIAGSGDDRNHTMAIDSAGDAFVVGASGSTEATLPVTDGPDATYNGGRTDGLIAEVNPAGTGFKYLGYLGGVGTDLILGVGVDPSGSAYVVGMTGSDESTFPVMVGPDLTYNGGSRDGFVAKISLVAGPWINSGPPLLTNKTTAKFTFVVDGPGSVTCTLDGGAPHACASPASLARVGDGPHTFAVTASGSTAYWPWTVDTTAPAVSIDSGPDDPTKKMKAVFSFSSPDPLATFTCSLDGAAGASCTSPVGSGQLGDGPHTFVVTATDPAGNSASAGWDWTVDTVAPTVTITSGPSDPTTELTATFDFTASEGGVTFKCSLDGSNYARCVSGDSFTVAPGPHTMAIRGTDAVGNAGVPDTWTWTVIGVRPGIRRA